MSDKLPTHVRLDGRIRKVTPMAISRWIFGNPESTWPDVAKAAADKAAPGSEYRRPDGHTFRAYSTEEMDVRAKAAFEALILAYGLTDHPQNKRLHRVWAGLKI